jgi:hypothetical protein
MSQRALPSVILSFLTVCFFAVALYQPDPPRSVRGGIRSEPRDRPARSGVLPPSGSQGADSEHLKTADGVRGSATSSTLLSRQPARSAGDSAAVSGLPPSPGNGGSGRRAPDEVASDSPHARARRASARASERPSITTRTAPSMPGNRRSVGVPDHRSAFTVVGPDETIEEIAFRVYGSSDSAETLWRANRDTLPRRDSPISAGMVLRTPRGR